MRIETILPPGGRPMTRPIAGRFCIYVDGAVAAKNIAGGGYAPLVIVRETATGETMAVRDLVWHGPSRFVHRAVALPGTERVRAWVETDAALAACLDNRPLAVLIPEEGHERAAMSRFPRIRGRFVVHLDVPVLRRNAADGGDRPAIAVRRAADLATPQYFREVAWDGPARLLHRPTVPVPNTNGRGVAFVETDGPLTVWPDDAPPFVIAA